MGQSVVLKLLCTQRPLGTVKTGGSHPPRYPDTTGDLKWACDKPRLRESSVAQTEYQEFRRTERWPCTGDLGTALYDETPCLTCGP